MLPVDPVMKRAMDLFIQSGLTLQELGEGMGCRTAPRQSAWQFLHHTVDPHLSMVRRFAKAVGIPLNELLERRKP